MVSLRVFLSSPGDVSDERALARRLLKEELPYDPLLRGRVFFEVVSWDDPPAPTPMPANLTPQEAVNRFGPSPSECDILIVILWSRLGTALDRHSFSKPNGTPYASGTEWEFENAWNAQPRRQILVYRRSEIPKAELNDPQWEEKRRQYERVDRFMERFRNPDGSFQKGWTPYATPTEFKDRLASDLKHVLRQRLAASGVAVEKTPPGWSGSPYPGLRAFTTSEASIFFGRGREVDEIITRLRDPAQRFLAVVAGSGTGKSSLVRAGVIPRLRDGALEGSQHMEVLSCAPGEADHNPFMALANVLAGLLPSRKEELVDIATSLLEMPERLPEYVDILLLDKPNGAALILFVDQLEELFTLAPVRYREPFTNLLLQALCDARLRVLVTVRSDFLAQCVAVPALAQLFQRPSAAFPLGPPGPGALIDMIRRPAERGGLELEDGLADEILKDAGDNPGSLPLVAFCLEELYRQNVAERRTHCCGLSQPRRIAGRDQSSSRRTF